MLIVLTILGCMILLSIYSKWERNQLTVEYYRILSKKIKSPCRFVFLSDLHEKEFGCGNKRLLEEIDRCHPDFVLIGGDLPVSRSGEPTDERDRVEKGIALLEELTRKYRVYYSFGNHEEKLFSKKECCGRKTLFEKALSKTVQLDGRAVWAEEEAEKRGGICLIGLPLDLSYYQVLLFKKKKALDEKTREVWNSASSALENRKGYREEETFTIALCHSPFYKEEALACPVDLVLSGHFHGGAVGIPFFALMTPQFRFFVRNARGLHRKGKQYYFISRGLGTHTVNIRIHDFPELSCFDLCPEE